MDTFYSGRIKNPTVLTMGVSIGDGNDITVHQTVHPLQDIGDAVTVIEQDGIYLCIQIKIKIKT